MNQSRVFASILIALCATTSGCGGGPELPPAYPTKGKVTVQGTALSGYLISFVSPDGKSGASAYVETDGTYSLETLDGRPGCEAGKFKVVIRPGTEASQAAMKNMMNGSKGPPKMESKVPSTYSSASSSPKEVEVKAVSNVIDIAI